MAQLHSVHKKVLLVLKSDQLKKETKTIMTCLC